MRTANGRAALCPTLKPIVCFLLAFFPIPPIKTFGIQASIAPTVNINRHNFKYPNLSTYPQKVQIFFKEHYPTVMELYDRHGILPSIKMAQAMLESGYGSSELSRIGNNYFGVKRKSNSEPGYFYKGDWYRRYDTPYQSFEHHSLFLLKKVSIRDLVTNRNTCYQSWVETLVEIRYAEDPVYGAKLTDIIERYHLYELDYE